MNPDHLLKVGRAYASLFSSQQGQKVLRLMMQQAGVIPDDFGARPKNNYEAARQQGRAEFMADILMSCRDGGMKVDTLGGFAWTTSGESTFPKGKSGTSSDSTTSAES